MQTITSVAPWAAAVQIVNIVLIVGIPTALLCLLQWWLSRRQSPVPGLILPVLHLLLSIVLLLSFTAYSTVSVSTVTTHRGGAVAVTDELGNTLSLEEIAAENNETPPAFPSHEDDTDEAVIGGADDPTTIYARTESTIPTVIGLLLLFNIPTALYVIIYAIQRRKLRRNRTVNKTLIQDL